MYEYECKVRRVIDGDSIICDVDLGFGVWRIDEHIRLVGIDTPESRTRNKKEKYWGKLATAHVKAWVEECGPYFTLQTTKKGKFGRYLGRVLDSQNRAINDILIERHLAVRYEGQSKDDIAEQHLANRHKYIDANYNMDKVADQIAKEVFGEDGEGKGTRRESSGAAA